MRVKAIDCCFVMLWVLVNLPICQNFAGHMSATYVVGNTMVIDITDNNLHPIIRTNCKSKFKCSYACEMAWLLVTCVKYAVNQIRQAASLCKRLMDFTIQWDFDVMSFCFAISANHRADD